MIRFKRESLEDYLEQLCDLQFLDLVLESFNFRLKILDAHSNKVGTPDFLFVDLRSFLCCSRYKRTI